jgi:Transposase DDE domain
MCERQQRGLVIAACSKVKPKDGSWLVPSQENGSIKYTVCPDENHPSCTCLDHETRGVVCKHIYAVRYTIEREYSDDGTITDMETLVVQRVRKTYPQNWPAYNAAQTNEKSKFQTLLHDLCEGLNACDQPSPGRGRPRIPMGDAIFAAAFKVYSTVSGRRFMSDLKDANEKGFIDRLPSYNSIFNILDSEATSGILQWLVCESALPMRALETTFASDSSGFSGSRFDRWYDHKFKDHRIKRAWCKCHIMCGVKSNIITAVEIHSQNAGDSPLLKPLLATTARQFNVTEVVADMGYLSESNFAAITDSGATPFIPFKRNSTERSGLWSKMYHYFHLNKDDFLARYHQRSNVESTFSMMKAKFGDSVRSKLDVSMKNEVLCKCLCHNLCCLIQASYELDLEPVFWAAA